VEWVGVVEGVRGEMSPALTTGDEEGLGCSSRLGVIGEICPEHVMIFCNSKALVVDLSSIPSDMSDINTYFSTFMAILTIRMWKPPL